MFGMSWRGGLTEKMAFPIFSIGGLVLTITNIDWWPDFGVKDYRWKKLACPVHSSTSTRSRNSAQEFSNIFYKISCHVLIFPDDPLQHDQHGLREQPGRLGHLRVPLLAAGGGPPHRPGVAPLQPRAQGHADTPLRGGFVIDLWNFLMFCWQL